MAVDIGPKDASPKRPSNFTLRRRQCAHSGRSQTARRTSQIDPFLPFKIDPMDGRDAPAAVIPQRKPIRAKIEVHPPLQHRVE